MSQHDVRLSDDVHARGGRRPDAAARLLLPVAEQLAELHRRGIAHGAVSPQAVAVTADELGELVDRDRVSPDPVYMAPTDGTGPTPADDVWAFAAVLAFAVTTQPPRSGRQPARYTGWLAPLAELALLNDPQARPSMADVAAYLRARVGPTPAPPPSEPGRSMVRLALAGLAVIILLGLAGAALLVVPGDDDEPATDAGRSPRVSASDGSADPPSSSAPTSTDTTTGPTAADLERFARAYVATASRDPAAGFALLTKEYQQQSPRYREVWTAITDPRVLSVTGDADRLTVTYTYRYSLPDGGRRTEVVTLRLVDRGGRLLIAGATSRPR